MNRQLFWGVLFITGSFFLISNSGGVPQAVTQAPGESGKNCGACHSGGIYNPTLQLTVRDSQQNFVTKYKPNRTYFLELVVAGENNPKSFGFQMVALSETGNKDMGLWSDLGQRVKNQTLLQRKYLVQSAPKTDGIFTMKWKAPSTDVGNIKFYYSGLAVNQTGNENGDSPISDQLTLFSSGTTNTNEDGSENLFSVYPNPVSDVLTISSPVGVTALKVLNLAGQTILIQRESGNNIINVKDLKSGSYIIEVHTTSSENIKRLIFQKL
jgi:hypothetical protein